VPSKPINDSLASANGSFALASQSDDHNCSHKPVKGCHKCDHCHKLGHNMSFEAANNTIETNFDIKNHLQPTINFLDGNVMSF